MHTTRTILALLTTALVAAPLSLPGAAAQAPDLPPACADALTRARDAIAAQRETLDLPRAMALVQHEAGAACGLDLWNGTMEVSAEAVRRFTQPTAEWQSSSTAAEVAATVQDLKSLEFGEPYPCIFPGQGRGEIDVDVLGIALRSEDARGEWHPVGPSLQVAGTGGIMSGEQNGAKGAIIVAGVPIPVAQRGTAGTCIDVESKTIVESECWNLVVYIHCTTEVKTVSTQVACSADAWQDLLGIVSATHHYETGNDGC